MTQFHLVQNWGYEDEHNSLPIEGDRIPVHAESPSSPPTAQLINMHNERDAENSWEHRRRNVPRLGRALFFSLQGSGGVSESLKN